MMLIVTLKTKARGSKRIEFSYASKFSCYEFKIDHYVYSIFYVSLMVTTKQKPIVDTHKKRRESKYLLQKITNSGAKIAREEERRKSFINLQKTINKMTLVSPCLSVTTLNLNGLNVQLKGMELWMDKKKKAQIYAYLRLTLGIRTHINSN